MAMNQQPQLLGCGHVDRMAAVCQFEAHGLQLCRDCVVTCQTCGKCLCKQHQRWVEWGSVTRCVCPDHVIQFYLQQFVKWFLFGGGSDGRV